MNKKGYKLPQVIIIIIFTSFISAITAGIIIANSFVSSSGKDYSEIIQDENLKEFLDVYAGITEDYYENVDKKSVIKNAINGMMEYLDESYTTYLDENSSSALKQELSGNKVGIGVSIENQVIIKVFDNTPAQKAGILPGDKIISINGVLLGDKSANINDENAENTNVSYLVQKNKDNVILEVLRNEQTMTFNLKAEEIHFPSVTTEMIDNTTIGYLSISAFSINLEQEVDNALTDLKNRGMSKLIIDLRSNTGGYLDQATRVASLFLKKDKVIFYLESKGKITATKDETEDYLEIPIVVLVNGGTASAAEILTAALHDSYGATIVGKTTYGKGKVQHTMDMDGGSMVKYTSSKWLTPNKTCIDEIGIMPDYNIDNEYIYDETNPEKPITKLAVDNQLNKAIELLSN